MKIRKLITSALLMLFCISSQAETITEDFESVTLTNADTWGRATKLSNGWFIQGGYIATSKDSQNYGFWSTAYNGSSKSLTAQYGSSNNAYVIIPVLLSGDVTFYYRRTSSDSRSAGKVYAYKVTESDGTYTIGSRIFMDESAAASWQKCTSIKLTEPTMIAFNMVRAAMDDVTYTTASLEPHEHSYSTTWSSDEKGHWHDCTSTVGICDAKKADYAEHDGLTCSVCGYESFAIRTLPWIEDFNSLTSGIPEGWDNSEGTTTTASHKWNYYKSYSDGISVRFDSYNNDSGITNVLATPYVILPAEGAFELKFKVKNPKGGNYTVKIGEYGSEDRTTVLDNLTNIASWTEKTVDLSAYAGKIIKVYFCGTSNWGNGDAYLYLDDVTVKEVIAHNHDYADTWSKDHSGHWHACLSEVGECDAPKADFAAHTYNADEICTVCGFEKCFEIDFAESDIPTEWDNNGWKKDGDHIASGSYNIIYTLTTSYLKAKKDDIMEIEAYLRYTDNPLTMEYSTDMGETWIQVFSEAADADHYSGGEIKTHSFTAPADGEYQFRFSGACIGLKSLKGFKDAYMKDIKESTLSILAANEWGTLCYPNDVVIPEGVTAYTATAIGENDVIELAEVEGTIPANTPVLLSTTANATLTLPATKHVTSLATPVTKDGNLLVGCTGAFVLNEATQYVLQKQNDEVAFYRVNPEKPITTKAYRCYLELPSSAAAKIGFSFGEATGISNVKTSRLNQIYDLNGRKVEKMQKGVVYIINNHKVIVK